MVLACRSLQKARDAAEEIKALTNNSEVVVRHLDLANLQSVRDFASNITATEKRLDILVNNAGVKKSFVYVCLIMCTYLAAQTAKH